MKRLSDSEALNKAAAYCTLCERCTSEVQTKLTAWEIEPSAQEHIIKRLIAEGFINEERYCKAFVNDKLRFNHWGVIKICAALREKHLPQNLIKKATDEIDEDEYMQILSKVIENKRKEQKNPNDYTSKQKIIRFAVSRGFEPNKIMQIIKTGYDEMDI